MALHKTLPPDRSLRSENSRIILAVTIFARMRKHPSRARKRTIGETWRDVQRKRVTRHPIEDNYAAAR